MTNNGQRRFETAQIDELYKLLPPSQKKRNQAYARMVTAKVEYGSAKYEYEAAKNNRAAIAKEIANKRQAQNLAKQRPSKIDDRAAQLRNARNQGREKGLERE